MSLMFALQRGLFQQLSQAFGALVPPVPVFDHIPEDQPYPFVDIGHVETRDADILADGYSVVQVPIGVHTRYRGQRQVHDYNAVVRATLHDQCFPVDAGAIVTCRVERQVNDRSADGLTNVASSILNITLEHHIV